MLVLTIAFAGTPAQAEAGDVMALIHADRWADAAQVAALDPDPVVGKLVTFYRLLSGTGDMAEIDAFLLANPEWPSRAALLRRREEALAVSPDDRRVLALCDAIPVTGAAALVRCAAAEQAAGRGAESIAALHEAWLRLPPDPTAEAGFLRAHPGLIGPDDMVRRYDRLSWSDPDIAVRELPHLDVGSRTAVQARAALRHDAPNAARMLARVDAAHLSNPGLLLEWARWLRRAHQDNAAAALWRDRMKAAQQAVTMADLPQFWDERNLLARRLLAAGDTAGAYALASDHGALDPASLGEAEFLAGWIALRWRADAAAAAGHFQTLAAVSRAVITQGRAHYWLARTASAMGDDTDAHAEYRQAAAYPTSYYGQLAALALHDTSVALAARLGALHQAVPPSRVAAFAASEPVRAAVRLVAWGEAHRARAFVVGLAETAPDAAGKSLAARLALGFGQPDLAVAVARLAGREGVAVLDGGWPVPFDVPAGGDPALALAIARQESNFDPAATSPVGALGLMQLMPATAQSVARQISAPIDLAALTSDARYNVRLGSAYTKNLLSEFGGTVPFAVAAYNAGPGRVREWRQRIEPVVPGGPGNMDMVDWIEAIPFTETRNYVQRVIESLVIYRVLRGDLAPHPLAAWQP